MESNVTGNKGFTFQRCGARGSLAITVLALVGCGLFDKGSGSAASGAGGTVAVSGAPSAGVDAGTPSSGGAHAGSGGASAAGQANSSGTTTETAGAPSTASPMTLYERTPSSLRAIEVDEARVYWNENAVLYAAPKDGSGPVVELGSAAGVKDVSHDLVAADATHVYWIEDSHLNRFAKNGSGLTRIELEEEHRYAGIRLDETHIYLVEYYCLGTARVPKAGGAAATTTIPGEHPEGGVTGMALDDENLYCARGPYIFRHPKAGGEVTTILSDADEMVSIGPLTSDGTTVYFGSNDRSMGASRNQDLKSIPSIGGEPTLLFHYGSPIGRILLDRGRNALYVPSLVGVSAITEVSLSAGTTRNVVENEDVPYGITQDEDYVYWVRRDGVIRRVKR